MTARTATKRTPVPPVDTLIPAKDETPGTDVARESLATLAAEVSPSVDILLRNRNLRGVAELVAGYGPRAAAVATAEEKAQAQAWLGDPVVTARAATQWLGAVDLPPEPEPVRLAPSSLDVPPANRRTPTAVVQLAPPARRWWKVRS